MKTREKFFKKFVNESFTGWGIFIIIATLVSNVCFVFGVWKTICNSVLATETYIFSMVLALISLNIAVVFFMPMLITKHQITDTVRDIMDKKFIEEKMERYATQMNIADLLQKVSTLLFWQERYIWSLSCALNALNEYMKLTPDEMRDSKIRNLWISIEVMLNIVVKKHTASLLEKEFPIYNEEIKLIEEGLLEEKIESKKERLRKDRKDMLIRFYIEIFELVYQKEELIDVVGNERKKQINSCLNIDFRKIINRTAKECYIEYEEIESEIRKDATPFETAETRGTARKMLEDLIKKLEAAREDDNYNLPRYN